MLNVSEIAKQRYTCKLYDDSKVIPAAQLEQLMDVLRYSPSSVNSQPWRFIIAGSADAKARIAATASTHNKSKILAASHTVVFCTRAQLDEQHAIQILAQEEKDNRFVDPQAKDGQRTSRDYYINIHRYQQKDLPAWMEKQTYIALGNLLFAAAALGIDSTPIEGFDALALDSELALNQQGFTSTVIACLGYRSSNDNNAKLAKSRLAKDQLIQLI